MESKSPQRTPMSPPLLSPIPEGMKLPEVIITRRTRTVSMSGRIEDEVREGTVKFFCRSRGHGFIDDDSEEVPVFMHISDIDGEYIPKKNDRVKFRLCPMPPKFDRYQAVHIELINLDPGTHHKWSEKETPEEIMQDKETMSEEAEVLEKISRSRNNSTCLSRNTSIAEETQEVMEN